MEDVPTPETSAVVQPVAEIAPPPQQVTEPALKTTPKPKPYRHPQLSTLPSKTTISIEETDPQFLGDSLLPVAGLKGNALFNAFLTFCSHSEQNAVLVSRAYVSQPITLHGEMLAIRQVPCIPHYNPL